MISKLLNRGNLKLGVEVISMHGCKKCVKCMGLLVLIIGIIFLLVDLKVIGFWGINWWSAVFIIMGGSHLMTHACPECKKAK